MGWRIPSRSQSGVCSGDVATVADMGPSRGSYFSRTLGQAASSYFTSRTAGFMFSTVIERVGHSVMHLPFPRAGRYSMTPRRPLWLPMYQSRP